MSFFEPVAALAATQHGTISRAQLIRIGVSPRQIRTLTSNGMLERLAPALYTLAGSSDTWERRLAVGLHRAGPLALVGARSASALWRLDRFRPGHVDLLGSWQGARTSTGVRVHRTIDLPTRDRTVLDHLPVTTPTRTLIDMGRYVGAGRLGKMMDDAVHRDLTTYEELHQRCGELARSGRNGIATVQEALADRPGGAVAPGSDFERQVRTLQHRGGPSRPGVAAPGHLRVDHLPARPGVAGPAGRGRVRRIPFPSHAGATRVGRPATQRTRPARLARPSRDLAHAARRPGRARQRGSSCAGLAAIGVSSRAAPRWPPAVVHLVLAGSLWDLDSTKNSGGRRQTVRSQDCEVGSTASTSISIFQRGSSSAATTTVVLTGRASDISSPCTAPMGPKSSTSTR